MLLTVLRKFIPHRRALLKKLTKTLSLFLPFPSTKRAWIGELLLHDRNTFCRLFCCLTLTVFDKIPAELQILKDDCRFLHCVFNSLYYWPLNDGLAELFVVINLILLSRVQEQTNVTRKVLHKLSFYMYYLYCIYSNTVRYVLMLA